MARLVRLMALCALWVVAVAPAALAQGPTPGAVPKFTDSNGTLGDSAITDGNGTVTINAGQLLIPDGSVTAPSVSFGSDPAKGIYSSGTNEIGIVSGGVKIGYFGTPASGSPTVNFFNVTGTLPSGVAFGADFAITPTDSTAVGAARFRLLPGATGDVFARTVQFNNLGVGTGTNGWILGTGNYGGYAAAIGTTAGHDVGFAASASGSSSLNLGLIGRSVWGGANSTAVNVGVAGLATEGVSRVGGFFSLQATAPTIPGPGAALMADNGTWGAPVFVARDHGTDALRILDGANYALRLEVKTLADNVVGQRIVVTPTQTANAFEIGDTSGNLKAYFDKDGSYYNQWGGGVRALHGYQESSFGANVLGDNGQQVYINTGLPGKRGLLIRGAQQAGPLLEFQDASGVLLGVVQPTGTITVQNSGHSVTLEADTGRVKASDGLCIQNDCRTSWSDIVAQAGVNYSNGNVGIGTSTPTAKLTVADAASPDAGLRVDSGAAGNGRLEFFHDGMVGHVRSAMDGGANSDIELDGQTVSLNTWTNNSWESKVYISNDGKVGLGTTAPTAKLHVAGDVVIDGNIAAKYQDVAEWVEAGERLPAGTVVRIDPAHVNRVEPTERAYDTAVTGVVSARPGILLGEASDTTVAVAQSGRVKVKVDASYGPIAPGDLLVASPRPGYAMRSQPVDIGGVEMHRPGTILGKALEPLASGQGDILVLLTLQ